MHRLLPRCKIEIFDNLHINPKSQTMKTKYTYILLFTIITLIVISCSKDEEAPQLPYASFKINPEEGFVGTEFTFNASESHAVTGGCSTLEYKWDYDGDGNWDTEYSDSVIKKHIYTKAGDFKPTLEIKDCDGWSNFVSKILTVLPDTSSSK